MVDRVVCFVVCCLIHVLAFDSCRVASSYVVGCRHNKYIRIPKLEVAELLIAKQPERGIFVSMENRMLMSKVGLVVYIILTPLSIGAFVILLIQMFTQTDADTMRRILQGVYSVLFLVSAGFSFYEIRNNRKGYYNQPRHCVKKS